MKDRKHREKKGKGKNTTNQPERVREGNGGQEISKGTESIQREIGRKSQQALIPQIIETFS